MSGLLGKKLGMTRIFDQAGRSIPVTVIEAGPCFVTQVKRVESDGYDAVQLGYEEKKEKHTTRPEMGHFAKASVKPLRYVREFKGFDNLDELKPGDKLTVEMFREGERVKVSGISKGRGSHSRLIIRMR